MIHRIYLTLNTLLYCCLIALLAGCDSNDMDKSTLQMNGDDLITAFSLNGQPGVIDSDAKTVEVMLEPKTDLTKLVPEFTLSEGASSNIPSGSTVDFTMPVTFKITNGNTYTDYTVTAKCYEAKMLTFTLANAGGTTYSGVIDETNHTVTVDLPSDADLTRLTASYTLSDGAQATPESGKIQDFSQPVTYTVTNHGDKAEYVVRAVSTDMPVIAFIGTAATVDGLKPEEKAAAQWMLANVPRSVYISMPDIISGKVTLDPETIKAVWWHGDRDDWPSEAWESKEQIKAYYANGGNLFLSRYACKYVNDVYNITLNGKEGEPNKIFSNPSSSLQVPLGFKKDDAAVSHPIFKDIETDYDATNDADEIYLIDKGFATTNVRVDWNVWDAPYQGLESWQNATGGKRLAQEADDWGNQTAIVEFPARTATAGKVICVGAGAFEWNISNDANNRYAQNRKQLALNILRYLVGLNQ